MTDKKQETENWLSSKEAKKVLKVSLNFCYILRCNYSF
ncbi:hypothetical protein RNAN_1248 [Rheinheimera nanhaiensis E407-8]|uniref:Uncharacterized protein n=1 Tax=Rheinheimera nanhaiensis E407-8 TaxID=562729 RepID=I1DW49_9GAMM|nr:hypothetical protein RNAN_1248 [Rheinheimera nanhaiensis E407-8]